MVFALISSCAGLKNQHPTEIGKNLPDWVTSPMAACRDQFEICASGEGNSLYLADLNAKKALASIFETEISSDVTASASTEGVVGQDDPSVKEEMETQIHEKVDQVLEGVEIKQRFQTDGVYFALAYLDKMKAWTALQKEMDEMDAKLVEYKKLKKRSSLKKMYTLFEVRNQINDRYAFLKGKALPQVVTLADIKQIQYGSSQKVQKIYFKVINEISPSTTSHLESLLVGFGHNVVDKDQDYDVEVSGTLTNKQEYMNVKGFTKYSFVLYLAVKKNNGKQIGGMTYKEVAVGRDEKDAYLKVEEKFKNYIEEHIDELNID
ncbi:MAG: LPP20 family lipoprotein [Bacteriovoracaceae bacterium]|nr:LPP20 family lipoprotein [Bacteriovoracaceae bacterium]